MRTDWNRSVKLFDNPLLRVEESPEVSGDRLRETPYNPGGEMLLGLPQEVRQQVGSERMPECMASDGLPDPGPLACILDGPLDDGVVEVVPEEVTGRWFRELAVCGKYPSPPP